MRSRSFRAVVVVVALALTAAACGGDDDDGGAAASGDKTTTTPASDKPAGEPLKIMQILENAPALGIKFESAEAGLRARAKRINAEGGLGGRPVEITVCETNLDPNKAAQCAQQAVDKGFVATLGGISQLGDVIDPILEKGGVPAIGSLPFTPADGKSAMWFPTNPGSAGTLAGSVDLAAQKLHLKSVSVAQLSVPGGEAATQYIEATAKALGLKMGGAVPIAVDDTDLTTEAQALADKGDAMITALTEQLAEQLIATVHQQGIEAPVLTQYTAVNATRLKRLGAAAEGLHLVAFYNVDPDTDANKQIKDDLEAAGEKLGPDDQLRMAWLAADLFATAAKDLKTIDRASLVKALGAIDAFDTGGLTPTIDLTAASKAPGQPRLFNTTVWFVVAKDGEATPDGTTPVDVFGG
jgi:ABC-type branched-subunit amino acid transport system substrate-binding protein